MGNSDKKPTDKKKGLGVKGDAFKKVSGSAGKDVKGGMPRRGGTADATSLNPTSSDGCCGC